MGCESVAKRVTWQRIPITSRPKGARVYVDGSPKGLRTPTHIDLDANQDHIVTIKLKGFHDVDIRLLKVVDAELDNVTAPGEASLAFAQKTDGILYRLAPSEIEATLSQKMLGIHPALEFRLIITSDDRLREVKRLRRLEIITNEEFEATKKQLLETP
ncbi:MAG: PEGA domain-containing protein [Candidatus Lindowbacteria bacterium]|nr:PEGA domain-containing protein [Candidatus Lindowbacteria bacterium]